MPLCRCDEDVDECDQDECRNGGECVNTSGSFYCNCSEGYEGQFCDDETPGDPEDDTQVQYDQHLKQNLCRFCRVDYVTIAKFTQV